MIFELLKSYDKDWEVLSIRTTLIQFNYLDS